MPPKLDPSKQDHKSAAAAAEVEVELHDIKIKPVESQVKNQAELDTALIIGVENNYTNTVTSLLKRGANPNQRVKVTYYSTQLYAVSADTRMGYLTELPSDPDIKAALFLVRFEISLKNNDPHFFNHLKAAYQADEIAAKQYIQNLVTCQNEEFEGIQHKLGKNKIEQLKAMPEFIKWHEEINQLQTHSPCNVM